MHTSPLPVSDFDAPDSGAATRRSVLAAGAVLAAAAVTGSAGVASAQGQHDHHAAHGAEGARHQALIDAALACVNRGEVCVEHCMTMLGKGDTTLKDCMRLVSTTMPMCLALARLGALDAPRLKEVARVCGEICADCEKECRKHQDHHAACKACAEACAACVKECKRVSEA